MEKSEMNVEELTAMKELLRSEKMEMIDFDKLIGLLEQCEKSFRNYHQVCAGEKLLRDDIIQRISGMEKAVAVVQRNKDAVSDAVDIIERLQTLSAEQLLKQFSRSRARFQSSFPTSFGLVRNSSVKKKDLSVYK